MTLKHGDIVLINAIYRRRRRSEFNGRTSITHKYWMYVPIKPRTAIYLGKRTLCNGTIEWESEEVGNVFTPGVDGYIKAILVSLSTTENPVYAPYDEIAYE